MKIGDLVQLKSGGPIMTVDCIVADSDGATVRVVWFSKQGQPESASFGVASLTTETKPSREWA